MNRTNRTMPTVGDVMTTLPRTIAAHQPIATARRLMKELGIRHLAVTSADGKLVGVVSERDLRVAQAIAGTGPYRIVVGDIMNAKVYAVSPSIPVNQVARTMATRKQGSAVVVDGGHILGIFTTTDALGVLADALEGKVPRTQAIVDVARRPERPKTRRTGREALV